METFEHSKALKRKASHKAAVREMKILVVAFAVGALIFLMNILLFGEQISLYWTGVVSVLMGGFGGVVAQAYFD